MKFSVLERIVLLGIMPSEANYVTHKIVTNLKSDLSFSEQELKDYKIVENEGRVTWDDKKEKPKEIQIGEKAQDIIIDAFKKLDKEGKINEHNVKLYEKFVLQK
jgi:hypothetical protein